VLFLFVSTPLPLLSLHSSLISEITDGTVAASLQVSTSSTGSSMHAWQRGNWPMAGLSA
jgi:hypothetical protein